MSKVLTGLIGIVIGVVVLSNNGCTSPKNAAGGHSQITAGSGDIDQRHDQTNVKVLRGKVHIEKSSGGEVKSITVTTADGDEVRVIVDAVSKDMDVINGHGVFATGSYTSSGKFKVITWFMRDKEP